MGEVLNNGVYLPDRGERNAYDGLKGNWNILDSIAGKVPGYDGHISDTDIHVTAADKQTWNGKADASHVHNANDVTTGVFDAARIPNLDASKITTGTIDIDRLPQGALERLVKVADQAARYALTAADVQLGDTVQQLDTGVMYVVTDETKLDSADGYTEYTAGSATSVPWSGVTGKPADYTPASHSHGNITNDGKVGTAANKPLITGNDGVVQAGSFGNAANTFCEGNDSRLSDARTPVAHTHTKSDVTDLLNSNFIPSANNSYDLGSSSYQWNNLYAKNYFYNGTPWGLDKANVWSDSNRFTKSIGLGNITSYTDCSLGFTGLYNTLFFNTRGSSNIPSYGTYVYYGYSNVSSDRGAIIRMVRTTDKRGETNDGYIPDTSFNLYKISPEKLFIDFMEAVRVTNASTENSLKPITNNATDLGTSDNKWKSLNGINPGALSLPDLTSNGYIELSNNISANTEYSYTPPADGWLALYVLTTGFHVENAVGIFNGSSSGNAHRLACSATSGINLARSNYYHGAVILPVIAGIPYLCWIKIDSSTTLAGKVLYFYKAAGNV